MDNPDNPDNPDNDDNDNDGHSNLQDALRKLAVKNKVKDTVYFRGFVIGGSLGSLKPLKF